MRFAVAYLAANAVVGVESFYGALRRFNAFFYQAFDVVKIFGAFGGLAEKRNRPAEIYFIEVFFGGYNNGFVAGLAGNSYHFGVALLPVNYDLAVLLHCRIVGVFYAVLQFQHYRAGSIYQFNVILKRDLVGFRWFAVGADQH